jgi:prevent-host-death family protein
LTDARRRFGALLDAAQKGPIVVHRRKRDVAIIVSAQQYERLIRGLPEKMRRDSTEPND